MFFVEKPWCSLKYKQVIFNAASRTMNLKQPTREEY